MRVTFVATAFVLIASAAAVAQVPGAPTADLDLIFDIDKAEIESGAEIQLQGTLTLILGGAFVCTQATTAEVDVTLSFRGGLDIIGAGIEEPIVVPIGDGVAFGGRSHTASFSVIVTANAEQDLQENLTFTANFEGGTIEGCQAEGPFPAANDETGFALSVLAPEANTEEPVVGGPDSDGAEPGAAPSTKKTPAPAGFMVASVVSIFAMYRRQTRDG